MSSYVCFYVEKNGVYMVDNIELLEDDKGNLKNLNLTYAVRDGIISHCGEIDENALKPRQEAIDLDKRTSDAWKNHRNVKVIEATEIIDQKIDKVKELITDFLNN